MSDGWVVALEFAMQLGAEGVGFSGVSGISGHDKVVIRQRKCFGLCESCHDLFDGSNVGSLGLFVVHEHFSDVFE